MDNCFLRLKSDMQEAFNIDDKPVIDLNYVGQVHLKPNETYLQISNSDTSINLSSYVVHIVDDCNNVIQEVTDNVIIENFIDSNGVSQIVWEYINAVDLGMRPVSLRFTEETNGDTWWTNLFVTSDYNIEYTSRIDYKNNGFHYGTEYGSADYYQSIRLTAYYNNAINESERSEYHQISTDVTVSQRNINKQKERFILHEFNEFTLKRLEVVSTCSEVYVNNKRYYSTSPIEFSEPEGNSNLIEGEWILNPTDDIFTFDYQLFSSLDYLNFTPQGALLTGTTITNIEFTMNYPITLSAGTLTVHRASDDVIVGSFDEGDMSVSGSTLTITTSLSLANGNYYVNVSGGLVNFNILTNSEIDNNTTWVFELRDADFLNTEFNNTDFFTN